MDLSRLSLQPRTIGPLPLIRRAFERLDLHSMLEAYAPRRRLGRSAQISDGRTLGVLITNVLVAREPLYAVPEWLATHDVTLLGLEPSDAALFNDDRIGRALDRLYETDPASFLTALLIRAVKEFRIELRQIHQDTTTVTFCGEYRGQRPVEERDRPPLITFGHNKDHRPDLKQLVYGLCISADGAVPIHFKTYDGNTTDDKVHVETWCAIRDLVGASRFLYVGDSKLCTRENMEFIHQRGGQFLTVLPRSRKEDDDFRNYVQTHPIAWQEVWRHKSRRGETHPEEVYGAFEPAERSVEGYRIVWYTSSVKTRLDAKRRVDKIKRAKARLQQLEQRTGAHRFRSVETAQEAADAVLHEEGARPWLQARVAEDTVSDLKQMVPGRPGPNTPYRKIEIPIFLFHVEENAEAIQNDALCDGLFAMVTNQEGSTPRELLLKYKYQPFLEKRNEQLKSVLLVAPILLKKPERVAALLFVYFLAALLSALIERELRRAMARAKIASLPLYPEERKCKAPTTQGIFGAFEGLRRSELVDTNGNVVKTFHDPLPPVALRILDLLEVEAAPYGP